ncbi:MAG: 23S rRNA (uracil(1939)-C(5))-methyltransferase RlmD [Erysipelotrichia bacterium]|nr:23S rRNA (uracil(1939)-C(5))-methyltransferase RlmD [Erysipelotrichia bacterium]NCC54461.1 23S rRNA (uracil(1939)-C(5))-methyltransferase RlmD [Erysipelotrichia bacterium]
MRVKIEKMGINGEGISFVNRQPVFVDGAIVNEEVDIKIVERQRRYSKGQLLSVVKRSKDRVRKPCKYANQCGACSLMHVSYDKQVQIKYDLLKESLIKYAQVNPHCIQKVVKNEEVLGYRNSFKLPFSMEKGKLVCGLYKPNTNYFIPVDHCLIHETGLERIRKELLKIFNKYHLEAYDYKKKSGLRTLVLRGFQNQYQCCVVSGETPLPQACIEECMQIEGLVSLWQNYHTVKKSVDLFGKVMIHLAGEKQLRLDLNGLKLTLSPKSFFQLNTAQAEKLYDIVADMVSCGNEFVVEAYSGIGAISLYIKDKAKEIVGIEFVSDAVSNANQNAKRNHAKNVSFVCGDAAEKLTQLSKKRKIDTLIVDPPRTGLDDAMLSCIMKGKMKHIIYVSCNPSTLGKNLAILQKYYRVEKIVPVDMFSNTAAVESVTLLVRK